MALINFQERFAEDVESGKKRQTIRKQRKYPIKTGETLYLYAGLRTKNARKLMIVKCKSVEEIKINWDGLIFMDEMIYLSNSFHHMTLDNFAQEDGFDNYYELANWFSETHGLPFEGILIKW